MSAVSLERARAAAPTSGPTDQQVQTYLLTGLGNRWWPVLPSRFIQSGGKPLGLTRLGEPLVIWRDSQGAVHVQMDRCPHRAVPLSGATTKAIRIRCSYHGVEVGPDGTVLSVPGQPGCPLEGKKAVKTYPSREIAGAIFVWFGDALHEEAPPFDAPQELVGADYSSFLCCADWEMAWRYCYDNLMDI